MVGALGLSPDLKAAQALAPSLKVYVYELSAPDIITDNFGQSKDDRPWVFAQNLYFEVALAKLMRKSRQRVWDPSEADFFYVPVEAVNCLSRKYDTMEEIYEREAACAAAAKEVVASMRSVGPYWDRVRHKHLVPSQYCWQKDLLPDIWDAGAVELCLNANAAILNRSVSINVPWFTPDDEFDLTFHDPATRSILANFIGSGTIHQPKPGNSTRSQYLLAANRMRWRAIHGLQVYCGRDCHVALLHRSMLEYEADIQYFVRRAKEAMGFSRFNVLPPGDLPARRARDQTIAAGSIPLVLDWPDGMPWAQEYPFSEVLDWSNFSLNFKLKCRAEVYGWRSFWPRLEKQLREMVASGRADKLSHGVSAIQRRFMWTETGILRNLFEVLALRVLREATRKKLSS